jgi:hypothetical protein
VSDLLQAFVDEVSKARSLKVDAAAFESGRRILALAPEQQILLLIELVNRQVAAINAGGTGESIQLKALVSTLLRRKLPFAGAQLDQLVDSLSNISRAGWWEVVGAESILRGIEGMAAAGGLPPSLRQALERLAAVLDHQQHEARVRKLSTRVRTLIESHAAAAEQPRPQTFGADEAWTRAIGAALDAMSELPRAAWDALLLHCTLARASKPSARWIADARTMLEAIGDDPAAHVLISVLGEIAKPGRPAHDHVNALGFTPDPTQIHEAHSDIPRGLGGAAGSSSTTAAVGARQRGRCVLQQASRHRPSRAEAALRTAAFTYTSRRTRCGSIALAIPYRCRSPMFRRSRSPK